MQIQKSISLKTNKSHQWILSTLTTEDALKALDGFLKGHQFAQVASEDLGHLEGLRQETLDLTGTGHSQFVFLRQFIHTQNGNDILQRFVVLEDDGKQVSMVCHVTAFQKAWGKIDKQSQTWRIFCTPRATS